MSTILWIIYFTFAVISFVPVIKLEQVKHHEKYRVLWYLSIAVFAWSVTKGLASIVSEPTPIYYFSILTYPIVFIIVYFIYLTFKSYMDEKVHKIFHIFAISFFVLNLVVSLTNPLHQWMLTVALTQDITNETFAVVGRGFFFYIHTFVSYTILAISFIKIIRYMSKRTKTHEGAFPFGMIVFSLIIGVQLNVIHVFFYTFQLDPTYLFVVIVTFVMYTIIYKRDFNVNLITSSRQYLLEKMREMYIITDNNLVVIEYSKNLKERFQLNYQESSPLEDFLKELKKKAIIYTDIKELNNTPFNQKKLYLHMSSQSFSVSRFKSKGTLVLLYDETEDMKLIHEIEELRKKDLMSGLFNRNYLEGNRRKLEKDNDQLGVVLIDIDGLKLRNDYLGHPSGDTFIIKFANAVLDLANQYNDMIPIRLGGDEFLIVIKKATEDKIEEIMGKLISLTKNKDLVENISFSYGYAVKKYKNDTLTMLMRRADLMLYKMKEDHKEIKERIATELTKKLDAVSR
jgi:diguanylate cyclase (GGDEF)-like protein